MVDRTGKILLGFLLRKSGIQKVKQCQERVANVRSKKLTKNLKF